MKEQVPATVTLISWNEAHTECKMFGNMAFHPLQDEQKP